MHDGHQRCGIGGARRARGDTVTMQVKQVTGMLTASDEIIRLGDGGPVPPGAQTVAHRRFEEVARTHPRLPAVVYYDETLSYGELNARADALAGRLRSVGIERASIVGICLP